MQPPLILLATVVLASAAQLQCSQNNFEELVAQTSCGDPEAISKCLSSGNAELGSLDQTIQCYVAGGCSDEDAQVGALRFSQLCRGRDGAELKKRADSTAATTAEATTTSSTTSSLICSTTTTVTTTTCAVISGSSTCSKTEVPVLTCVKGLLCSTSEPGPNNCMEKINTLDTGGWVVAGIFSTAIIATMIVFITMCVKSRQQSKQRTMEHNALLAGYSGKGKSPEESDIELPLMENQQGNGTAPPKLNPGLGALGYNRV